MTRLLGLFFVVLTIGLVLGNAAGQGTKQGKLDVNAIFKKLDANNDGKLQKDEFLKLADQYKNKEKARAKLAEAFKTIDPENRGITKDVFRRYLDSAKKKTDGQTANGQRTK